MTKRSLFAKRTDWPLAPNRLSAAVGRLREERVPILDLTESNPTRCGFSYPDCDILKPLAGQENLGYAPAPRGDLNAREVVGRYYQEKGLAVSPEQIFLTASTSEAYSYLFRLLADPGGRILFPRPSYPLFAFLGDLNDVRMDTYPLVYGGKWGIDLQEIRRVFGVDTKALVLVNPNNPTGSFVRRRELEELNALCLERRAAIICDEVFADFVLDGEGDYVSLAGNDRVLTFVLGGISKTLGLPQMKLSWIVINGPAELAEEAGARLEVIADTYLSVNTPAQNALPAWLSLRGAIQGEINARIRENYVFLKEKARGAAGCELLAAEGGWYAVLRIPDRHSEEEWALTFLNKDHVFVHPGYFFDFDAGTFVVASLLPLEHVFREGIQRILTRVHNRASQNSLFEIPNNKHQITNNTQSPNPNDQKNTEF